MKNEFEDKNILITGGTGSLGRELIKWILEQNPKVVRIFDINENQEFEFGQEIGDRSDVRFFLGDIRDERRLARAMEGIDIVFHAAALKHVAACEYNPSEAVKTNVLGTQNIINAAMDEEVEKVLFTSSDKAVNPTNTMGTTKLLAEKLITAANYYKGARKTVFFSVRFGNILGSSGSALPLFKKQVLAGGPVTITDRDMTRFVMSMAQGLDLTSQSLKLAQGGEVFILKMPSIRIEDLAEVIIQELSSSHGLKSKDIKMEVIGSKAGEKLYEELMTKDESRLTLETDDMFIVLPQMKELSIIDRSRYNAGETNVKSLNSRDMEPLEQEAIRDLLLRERLLD